MFGPAGINVVLPGCHHAAKMASQLVVTINLLGLD